MKESLSIFLGFRIPHPKDETKSKRNPKKSVKRENWGFREEALRDDAAVSLTGVVVMALRALFTKRAPTLACGVASAGGIGTGWQGLCHARGLKVSALPDLEYDYGALEPAISREIMRLHHQKHHKAYVSNYNDALEKLDAAMANGDVPAVVRLQSAIKFNGGGSNSVVFGLINSAGHINHTIFWKNLKPVKVNKERKKLLVETTANQVFTLSNPIYAIEFDE
ncbi:hypothetical protein GW17_00002642 [Ensete ventricosum]|nr:hypothetical protein GW17_00002642 [Ensete ventricosum]RZR80354.1 hypothetical protein BHM03_00006380 [Ensete ventricosum]